MISFKLIFFVVFVLNCARTWAAISDKRLCANPECTVPISKAKTMIKYHSPEKGVLSFGIQEDVTVFSKSAGSNMDLWGVEIRGRRGYVPKSLLRESKIEVKFDSLLVVDTEFASETVPSNENSIEADKPFVVDGTTIYDEIRPSATEAPPLATTTVPQVNLGATVPKSNVDLIDINEQKSNAANSNVETQEDIKLKPSNILSAFASFPGGVNSDEGMKIVPATMKIEENVIKSSNFDDKKDESVQEPMDEEDKIDLHDKIDSDTEQLNVVTSAAESSSNLDSFNKIFSSETKKDVKINTTPEIVDEIIVNQKKMLSSPELVKKEVNDDSAKSSVFSSISKIINGDSEEVSNEGDDEDEDDEDEYEEYEEDSADVDLTGESKEEIQKLAIDEINSINNLNNQSDQKVLEATTSAPDFGIEDPFFEEFEVTEAPIRTLDKAEAELNISEILESAEEEISANSFESVISQIVSSEPSTQTPEAITEAPPTSQISISSPEIPIASSENTNSSPDIQIGSPELSNLSPQIPIVSPEVPIVSPEIPIVSPVVPIASPEIPIVSPEVVIVPPEIPIVSPEESIVSPELPIASPEISTASSEIPIVSPEVPVVSPEIELLKESDSENDNKLSEGDVYFDTSSEKTDIPPEDVLVEEGPGFFDGFFSFFKSSEELPNEIVYQEDNMDVLISKKEDDHSCSVYSSDGQCSNEEKPIEIVKTDEVITNLTEIGLSDLLILLGISAVTIVVFLWGFMIIDKMRKEAPLIAKINELEKSYLVSVKESQLLNEKLKEVEIKHSDQIDFSSNAMVEELKAELDELTNIKVGLEEQVQSLEKELENSSELGFELNRMLSDVLSSQNGSDTLMANVEHLQKQLIEQQSTINSIDANLNEKDTENHELQLELEIKTKKMFDLQSELDKMVINLLKMEEEKEGLQNKFELEISEINNAYSALKDKSEIEYNRLNEELNNTKKNLIELQRTYSIKTNEYNLLKDSFKENESFNSVIEVNSIKAELQQLKRDNQAMTDHLQQNQQVLTGYEKRMATTLDEMQVYKQKYEEADQQKLESLTRLEVLSTYFKARESELQKELSKHESIWIERQGEATSTTERIRFMQEEVQNFKAQNGSLKQEIIAQEVELKSQISVLEKKAHENWVAARQAERKFEDARQEAAQLRNRLTLRERSFMEEKSQNRLQSPLEANGDHLLSPIHMNVDVPTSPALLFGGRDHLTTSPPLPSLPPFLPPPPGVPFMPPPLSGPHPPFMPPPPSMYPGDHRPPPLGRMSSPPLGRYSPDSRPYSPYDRISPTPSDDYYMPHRGYSPYSNGRDERDRRDHRKPPPRNKMRNSKGATMSSGSNESLENNKHHSKV